MSSIAANPAAPSRRRVLADVIARPSSRARAFAVDAALVLAGVAVVALLAQVEIPLWPVPITGQTLGVIIVGASLGAWRGAASAHDLHGAGAGRDSRSSRASPVRSSLIAKPSFGFVIGFIFSAFVAGWFAERAWDRRPALAFVGFAAASVVPFLFGIPYLAFVLNVSLGLDLTFWQILEAGLFPFIIGGLVKAGIAALIIPRRMGARPQGRRQQEELTPRPFQGASTVLRSGPPVRALTPQMSPRIRMARGR